MNRRNNLAFSLLELIAVVAILGVIAALVVPRTVANFDVAREKTCYHNRTEINIAVERYYIDTGNWPANDLSDIGAAAEYFPGGLPTCPVSGAHYRLDPETHRVVEHASDGGHEVPR